ncbi:MAG: hypothetical protein EZS28_024760 [Streblomastix strix]|uniref:Uncharacterized protein n=1 Tax=Streblomastix strix TaxID=222440 RepID=A0A5J4VBH2_9EUKA|nr:MAG: hypothetical protein EZS28_024760 [Streblomastix strix]
MTAAIPINLTAREVVDRMISKMLEIPVSQDAILLMTLEYLEIIVSLTNQILAELFVMKMKRILDSDPQWLP